VSKGRKIRLSNGAAADVEAHAGASKKLLKLGFAGPKLRLQLIVLPNRSRVAGQMLDPKLQTRLNNIPHLDLGMSFDLGKLRADVAKITRYARYETRAGPVFEEMYRKAWAGRSLIGYESDSRKGIHDLNLATLKDLQVRSPRLVQTDLAQEMPCVMDVVQQLDAWNTRVRIMVISPQSNLAWHSHMDKLGQAPHYVTVHIPIEMPEGFTYEVTQKKNLARVDGLLQPVDGTAIHTARYPVGRATCFNSYHYHNVFNRNPTKLRISIMLYMDLSRDIPRKIFENALASYVGPIIA
jgi:hypothetical protein